MPRHMDGAAQHQSSISGASEDYESLVTYVPMCWMTVIDVHQLYSIGLRVVCVMQPMQARDATKHTKGCSPNVEARQFAKP